MKIKDNIKLIAIGLFIISIVVSWLTTFGFIKLITLCFGLRFNWLTATGIWLIAILVGNFLKKTK